jgi:hypothetical protein
MAAVDELRPGQHFLARLEGKADLETNAGPRLSSRRIFSGRVSRSNERRRTVCYSTS